MGSTIGCEAGVGRAGISDGVICARASAISIGDVAIEGLPSARNRSVGASAGETCGDSVCWADAWARRFGGDRTGGRAAASCGAVGWMLSSATGAGGSSRRRSSFARLVSNVRHSLGGFGFCTLCGWFVAVDGARRPSFGVCATPPDGAAVAAVGVRRSPVIVSVGSPAAD